MITLTIDGADYSEKITGEPQEETVDLIDSANSFTSLANTRHRYVSAVKKRISVSLSSLDEIEKTALMSAVSGKNFNVVYNGAEFTAYCESRASSCYYSDDKVNLYDVTITIEEV